MRKSFKPPIGNFCWSIKLMVGTAFLLFYGCAMSNKRAEKEAVQDSIEKTETLRNDSSEPVLSYLIDSESLRLEESDTTIFTVTEIPAVFPGGDDAFNAYLRKSIRYPKGTDGKKIKGKVSIEFVVEKDGSISNVHPVSNAHELITAETIRLLRTMPRWSPAIMYNDTVRSRITIKVLFGIK